MQAEVQIPKAFSVRDDHEFFPIQHLMARLNPRLMVVQVATGRHIDGSYTSFWGIVFDQKHPPTQRDVEAALGEAGFDLKHGVVQPFTGTLSGNKGPHRNQPDLATH
jgi:hypothetical protein